MLSFYCGMSLVYSLESQICSDSKLVSYKDEANEGISYCLNSYLEE